MVTRVFVEGCVDCFVVFCSLGSAGNYLVTRNAFFLGGGDGCIEGVSGR